MNKNKKEKCSVILDEQSKSSAIVSALTFMEYYKTLIKEGLSKDKAFQASMIWMKEIMHGAAQAQNAKNFNNTMNLLKMMMGGSGKNGIFNDGSFGRMQ